MNPDHAVPDAVTAPVLALDATGQRKKAIDHYRIAAKNPPLVESASPHLYQRVAYRAPARSSTAERPKPQGKPDGAR